MQDNRFLIAIVLLLLLATLFLSACQTLPAAVIPPTTPETVKVTLKSSAHSSDLFGYAWIQEFGSSNDADAANTVALSESARAGAVCYASIAPSVKSAPSASDGSFSVTFDAEPGSTFRIMCDPDSTHPGALGIDVFTVPAGGGTIDHATAGFASPFLNTVELGIANDLAAKAAGYTDAEEMFQTAGTCRALAMPLQGASISVSEATAYGFYMEAPDKAGRVTILEDPSRVGAYIVVKEFAAGEEEANVNIDFTDISGAGLTWETVKCPIKKGFSTNLEVFPEELPSQSAAAETPEEVVAVPTVSPEAAPTPTLSMIERISVEDTKARWDTGDAVIVDVRSKGEYEWAHIPGALAISSSEFIINDHWEALPLEAEIILYCT